MPRYSAKVLGKSIELLAMDEKEAIEICQKMELDATRVVLDQDRLKYSLVKLPDRPLTIN